MTDPIDDAATNNEHVQITDDGRVVAAAEVSTPTHPHGTARVILHAESGHLPVGTRANLVDAVMDLPTVQSSDHLEAYAPIGDSESLSRIRQRSTAMRAHAAGCTTIIEADVDGLCECHPADPA